MSAKEPMKIEKAAQLIMEYIQLPDDQYRLGKTKVLSFTRKQKKSQILYIQNEFF